MRPSASSVTAKGRWIKGRAMAGAADREKVVALEDVVPRVK